MTGSPGPVLCLVLGAPRSGTTWLQRLLATSPRIVSPQESGLFTHYLAPQQRAWRAQVQHLEAALGARRARRRVVGLPTLLTDDDLLDSQRLLLDRFVDRALATKPGAALVVEKTPSHSRCVDVVDRVAPSTRFLHIVRDPRDVMASLRDASAGWGRSWAPADPVSAARLWLRHVDGAREAAAFGPDRYLELRYEDLRARPRAELGRLLAFLGLPDEPGALVGAEADAPPADVLAFAPHVRGRLAALDDQEPTGFRGSGRRPLDRRGRRAAEIVAGERARELGYTSGWEAVPNWALRLWAPPLHVHRVVHGVRRRWARRGPAVGDPG